MTTDSSHLGLAELQSFIAGKTIAVVGNAVSIFNDKLGAEIDAHDIVIRMNYGYVKDPAAQGSKTTIWGGSVTLEEDEVNARFLSPPYCMWLTPKREIMPDYSATFRRKLFLHPLDIWEDLYRTLGSRARPTTGMMIINFVIKHCQPAKIDLYGFDFFQSRTFYDRRLPKNKPHDFNAEAAYVEGLCDQYAGLLELKKPSQRKKWFSLARLWR